MKISTEYMMICTHYLVSSLVLEISNETAKKRRDILSRKIQQLVEKTVLDNENHTIIYKKQ